MRQMRISIGILATALVFLGGTVASAQSGLQDVVNPQMSIDLSPTHPQPGETVTATLNDYGGGTFGASVTWLYNGQEIPQAQNRRQAEVVAGQIGDADVLEVILTRANGSREVLRATVRPVYIDIIFEPQTRVPDFYLGRSLPSIGSIVNATILVNTGVFEEDLVYTWRLNETVLEGGPLRGRNKITFEMPMGDSAILAVQVTRPNGQVIGSRAILVPSVQPQLRFYEVNALLGVRSLPIRDTFSLISTTATVRAEPFHLDSRVFNDPSVSEWEVNRRVTNPGGGNPYEITLQRAAQTGSISLGFHVRSTEQVLQGVEDRITIQY